MEPESAPTSLIDLLDQMVPPEEPPPIPMVPQTWGWAVLALLLLAAIAAGLVLWMRHRRASAYRRAAGQMLGEAGDDPARIAAILRRTALAAYPRSEVAGLGGAAWLDFLDRQIGGEAFRHGVGQAVAEAPYRPLPADPQLTDLARRWVAGHRVEGGR